MRTGSGLVRERADQTGPVGDDHAAAGTSTSGTSAFTNGHQRVAPVGGLDGRAGPGPLRARAAVTVAERATVQVVDREPDELVVVELLGVLRRVVGGQVGVQHGAARGLGAVAVGDLLEA